MAAFGAYPQDPHPPWALADQGSAPANSPWPPDLAAATFDDWPAPSAEDYLTDPLYPFEV
jgi:hypothetical protein